MKITIGISLVIREMQIKTSIRDYLSLVRITDINIKEKIRNVVEDILEMEPMSYTIGEICTQMP